MAKCYTVHLRPTIILHNCLPSTIKYLLEVMLWKYCTVHLRPTSILHNCLPSTIKYLLELMLWKCYTVHLRHTIKSYTVVFLRISKCNLTVTVFYTKQLIKEQIKLLLICFQGMHEAQSLEKGDFTPLVHACVGRSTLEIIVSNIFRLFILYTSLCMTFYNKPTNKNHLVCR